MKRIFLIAVLVVVLMAVGAIAAFAAPGSPVRGSGMMGQGAFGGYGMMGRGQGAPGGYGMMAYGAMMGDDLEALLGLDHADIHAAHVAGKSLVDIAAEKGVTEEQLIKAILDGRQKALAQAVTDGRLTQDTADQMLNFMETNIKAMVEAKGVQGMMGGAQGVPGSMMGLTPGGGGPCHGGQAPAQSGTGIRNNMQLAPKWLQQG